MAVGEEMDDSVWTDEAHESVDGYAAIPMNDVGWGQLSVDCPSGDLNSCGNVEELENVDGTSYLPLAQTNNDWNTTLFVSNVEGATSDASLVEVELVPTAESENDAVWSEAASLSPGGTWRIDLADEVGTGWIGSVRITSDAGTAAVAARSKAETGMMLMNTSAPSRADNGNGYRLSAPLVYVDYFDWNTGISIANQSSQENHIDVSFYDADGELVGDSSQTIEADGHGYIYLPGEFEDDEEGEWLGAAVLESASDRPFHASVDQVNYADGAAMSYTLGTVSADDRLGNQTLGLPLFQKAGLNVGGDTSGIQLFNPDPQNDVEVEIHLYEDNGSPIMSVDGDGEIQLAPLESYTFYASDEADIPMNTAGSALVSVSGGDGEVVGVSNLVNYEVQGDGAVVFSLSNGEGQQR